MKIVFVDHSFHEKTRSSDFFVQLLGRRHEVKRLYVDPADRQAMEQLAGINEVDLAVLWQMDFLAPILLGQGLPTVVVPMFDGSSLMPDLHWLWSRQARFVSFCRRLHDRIRCLECSSLLVKYYLPPVREKNRARFEDLRILLWQRRPEEGIHLGLVQRLFGAQASAIHIHDAPDDSKLDTSRYLSKPNPSCALTVSRWFPDCGGFHRLLDAHNVLVAPRRAEGIGMVMLEGLARGMLVVAVDAPTHDEYISNWISGVLFNPDSTGLANFDDPSRLGEMAWRSVTEGYERWRQSELGLLDFIAGTPAPKATRGLDVSALGRKLVRAYLGGRDAYHTFLLANTELIEHMSGISLRGKLDRAGRYGAGAASAGSGPLVADFPWLDQNRLDAAGLASSRFCLNSTATRKIDDRAWIVGQSLMLGFRLDPELGATRRLRLGYSLPPSAESGLGYCITLNGHTLGIGQLERAGELELAVPPQAILRDNILHFQLGAALFAFDALEPLSLGISALEFV